MVWVSTKILLATLVLVRLVAVNRDESPVLDPKGVLQILRKHRPPVFGSAPAALPACTCAHHRSRDELKAEGWDL